VFKKAGESFDVTLTAVQWQAGDDPNNDGVPESDALLADNVSALNFGLESMPATANLQHSLAAPSGGAPGALGGSTSFGGFVNAAKTQAVSWSEVGFINLTAETTNYLGGGSNITNSAAGLPGVGRFVPDHLAAFSFTFGSRADAGCSPASLFTYMSENIGIGFTLEARNASGVRTQNYHNYDATHAYARLDTKGELGLAAVSGANDLSARVGTLLVPVPVFVNGLLVIDTRVEIGRRGAPNDDPDGPFPATAIGIAPTDEDGTALQPAALDLNVDGAGGNDHQAIGTTDIRYGRLRLESAVGSENLPLPIRIETQVWNGTAFVRNTQDDCTVLPRNSIVLDGYTGALNPGAGNCKTFVQQDPIAFGAGAGTLTLASPSGAAGTVRLTANLGGAAAGTFFCDDAASPPDPAGGAGRSYLLGRWDDAANPDGVASTRYDDNPSSRAAFGLFGAQPNNFIYFRENF
jgi:MSHA biogenesis protein MshQ